MSIEKNTASSSVSPLLRTLVAAGLLCSTAAAAQEPMGCMEPSLTASVALTGSAPIVTAKGTEEWESEVIKWTVIEPGLIAIAAEGPAAQGALYAFDSAGGPPRLLADEQLGSTGRTLAAALEPGEYCLRVIPTGLPGSLRVRAELLDRCRVSRWDDHSDASACATALPPGLSVEGRIGGKGDRDLFTFELSASTATSVEITGSGSCDLAATLHDESGRTVAVAGGDLEPGRYFVQVECRDGLDALYQIDIDVAE